MWNIYSYYCSPQDNTVEEGLQQITGVQDDVVKKMEQYVDQLTTGHHYIIISDVIYCLLYSSSVVTADTDPKNNSCTNETNS